MSRSVPTRLWAWSGLGLAGSLIIALAAPRALHDRVVGWWYHLDLPGSQVIVWAGMATLAVAWLGITLDARRRRGDDEWLTARTATLIAVVWVTPLVLAPPLFSRDVYSYLAQGTILHLGLNPYHVAPSVLAAHGHGHTLAAVSTFWRHTTAPYGPLFLELVSLIVGICGQHLIAGVLLCRGLDLIGLALVAVQMPRLTRALGGSAATGTWLALASPLTLLSLVAACHNDLLMAGLLLTGVAWALRGNPLLGVAMCALAATIKIPALVGAVFIAVCWARAEATPAARARFVALCALIIVAVLGVVTAASGVGVGWLGSAVVSTPAKARIALTPWTALGYTVASLLHDAGVSAFTRSVESAFGLATAVLIAGTGLVLLARVRIPRLTVLLGATLVIAAAGGPAAWPWYLSWGLLLLCAGPGAQRSFALLVPFVVGGLLIEPSGTLVLAQSSSPAVLVVYILLAGAAWMHWGRHRSRIGTVPRELSAPVRT